MLRNSSSYRTAAKLHNDDLAELIIRRTELFSNILRRGEKSGNLRGQQAQARRSAASFPGYLC
jgi:hypothetical protein